MVPEHGQAAEFGHLDRQTADGGHWVDQGSHVDPENPFVTEPCG